MIVGGLQKFSLIDYPGKTCAVVFTLGCNFRCPYCHNPELVIPDRYAQEIPLSYIFAFLEKRKGMLDAVCVTGGEPTLQNDLVEVLAELKDLGYLIKLDTNGSKPGVLELLIEKKLIDYLAMDIKAPLEKYSEITGKPITPEKLKKSISLVISSGIDHEFRTTAVKSLISKVDLEDIARTIKGADRYFLQGFVSGKICDESFLGEETYSEEELREVASKIGIYVKDCYVR